MATGKTSTLTFRIEPALKEALRASAAVEHRSIANMVEVMIREYCGRTGVGIAEEPSVSNTKHATTTIKAKPPRVKKSA